MPRYINLAGQRFGRLTVLEEAGDSKHEKNSHVKWLCKCDCGNLLSVRSNSLRNGTTLSCGCYHSDRVIQTHTKHGMYEHRLYKIYRGMLQRCNNPNAPRYDRYGGRGIMVCDEWEGYNGFENFCKWALSTKYNTDLTLDRIDNDKGYSPNNCRWADKDTQNNNKSSSHYITYNGETKTIAQWAKVTGINKRTICSRISQYGWNEIDAITLPVIKGRRAKNV